MAWDRVHPCLTTRSTWIDHTGELPVIEGTLIRLEVDRLSGGHEPLPVRPGTSATGLSEPGRRLAPAVVLAQIRSGVTPSG
jgi:hypothetical protein